MQGNDTSFEITLSGDTSDDCTQFHLRCVRVWIHKKGEEKRKNGQHSKRREKTVNDKDATIGCEYR